MSQKSKTSDSKSTSSMIESDLKGCSNYEALFDSGYNSNMQSSSFLELDSQSSITSDLACSEQHISDRSFRSRDSMNHSKTNTSSLPQWSDSGVSITDSGLGIVEDESHHEQDDKALKKCCIDPEKEQQQAALKTWLENNNVADA